MFVGIFGLIVIAVVATVIVLSAVKVVPESERGVLFRLGKVMSEPKGPGLVMIIPGVDKLVRVNLAPQVRETTLQKVITADGAEIKGTVAAHFRVADPVRAAVQVTDYSEALAMLAGTAFRTVAGNAPLTETVKQGEKVAERVREYLARETGAWGLEINRIELKLEKLPLHLQMQCDMAK